MGDLCCHVSILHDDVVTSIIKGADDSQLVVEWVVGTEAEVLVGVGRFPVSHLPPPLPHYPYLRSAHPEIGGVARSSLVFRSMSLVFPRSCSISSVNNSICGTSPSPSIDLKSFSRVSAFSPPSFVFSAVLPGHFLYLVCQDLGFPV